MCNYNYVAYSFDYLHKFTAVLLQCRPTQVGCGWSAGYRHRLRSVRESGTGLWACSLDTSRPTLYCLFSSSVLWWKSETLCQLSHLASIHHYSRPVNWDWKCNLWAALMRKWCHLHSRCKKIYMISAKWPWSNLLGDLLINTGLFRCTVHKFKSFHCSIATLTDTPTWPECALHRVIYMQVWRLAK